MSSSSDSTTSTISSASLERLSTAGTSRSLCQACKLDQGCNLPYMTPYIPPRWTRKVLGVGEAPGEQEDKDGRPFTGRSGKLLYSMLRSAGYGVDDVALVNAVRCHPHKNATPTMLQLRACRPFLLRVVEQLQPAVVYAFGASAAKAILDRGTASVTGLRGRVFELRFDTGVVPVRITYHPAAILRGATHLKKRVIADLRRSMRSRRRELSIVSTELTDKVLAVDTEYHDGNLLTLALASGTEARAWDVAYHPGATE